MTYREFVRLYAMTADHSQKYAADQLSHLFAVGDGDLGLIPARLLAGDRVVLPGFGTFSTGLLLSHRYWHRSRGEVRMSLPRLKLNFQPAKAMRTRLLTAASVAVIDTPNRDPGISQALLKTP